MSSHSPSVVLHSFSFGHCSSLCLSVSNKVHFHQYYFDSVKKIKFQLFRNIYDASKLSDFRDYHNLTEDEKIPKHLLISLFNQSDNEQH